MSGKWYVVVAIVVEVVGVVVVVVGGGCFSCTTRTLYSGSLNLH